MTMTQEEATEYINGMTTEDIIDGLATMVGRGDYTWPELIHLFTTPRETLKLEAAWRTSDRLFRVWADKKVIEVSAREAVAKAYDDAQAAFDEAGGLGDRPASVPNPMAVWVPK